MSTSPKLISVDRVENEPVINVHFDRPLTDEQMDFLTEVLLRTVPLLPERPEPNLRLVTP